MRHYMVRRTRGFIRDVYAELDPEVGRKFLLFEDGTRSYFPERIPRTVKFLIDERNPTDVYAKLYAQPIVDLVNALTLPRYGLGNYIAPTPDSPPTQPEARIIQDLSRAGRRLMGFCHHPFRQTLDIIGSMNFEVRTATDPRAMIPAVRRAVQDLDKDLPLFDVKTQNEQVDELLLQERMFAKLSSFFGILALLLACVGLYGIAVVHCRTEDW